MFEFLNGKQYYDIDFEGEVIGFNEENDKLIIQGETNDNDTRNIEIDVFKARINQNIDDYKNWQEKLYYELIRSRGFVNINILSIENDACWNIEIYRHKELLEEFNFKIPIILTHYTIVFVDEVRGDILSFQNTEEINEDEELKIFTKWIDEQIEKVPEFNTSNFHEMDAIIASEAFNTKEELDLLYALYEENTLKLEEAIV
jgi:hypothetical protein